jgi:hypothetical protein
MFPHLFIAIQKKETPKGNEKYSRIGGSSEKMPLKRKLINLELISFSDLILRPKRRINRLAKRIGKNRKKLK